MSLARTIRTTMGVAVMASVLGWQAADASANLLVHESFSYSVGDLTANNTSAQGLTGAWSGSTAFDVTAGSLTYPASSSLSSTGNKVALAGSNGTNPRVDRALSSPISFDADGVYYISYLMNRTELASGSRYFYVALQDSAAADQVFQVKAALGVASSGAMQIATNNAGSEFTAGPATPAGQDVWVIGKVVTKASGNDEIYMAYFSPSSTIPASDPAWNVSRSAVITGSANQLLLMGGADTQVRFDEIRIGTTFDSVVVPTPATLPILLPLAGLAALRRYRR